MKFRVALFAAAALCACGDNSNECDPGTTRNENGVCIGTLSCSDGTVLVDGKCEIDPNACQGGTVLVGDACVDPGVVAVDIEEAAEPNGAGLGEASTAPAGEIMLKAEGEHFVIHGKIVPFRDADGDEQLDPDFDTYVLEVAAPTMLTVTADGINGLAGGFFSVANVASTDPLSDWTRFGVNLTGDTSKRQLYLPVAGTYLIAIGDSRTLLLTDAAAGAPEGKPAFEYYVTIDRLAVTPTPLTLSGGTAVSTGTRQPGEVKVFSVALGEGINDATLDTTQVQVQGSVLITNTRGGTTRLVGLGDQDAPDPAGATALGIRAGDTSLVIADSVLDYAGSPTFYELTVNARSAGALSNNGGTSAQPADDVEFTVFYYDVPADGLTTGMNLSFDKPVAGVVVDEDFSIFSAFTLNRNTGNFGGTFSSYKGLLRHAKPGRYYFLVFDPAFTGTTAADITATSTYAGVAPTPLVNGTPLTNQAITAFESNAFSYTPNTATIPWQTFTGSGTGTGTLTAAFYNPSVAGRLDTLTSTCAACNDSPAPLFTQTYAEAGQTRGRILLDQMALTTMLVTVNTATVTGTPTFSLDFGAQANVNDLGTANVGTPVSATGKALDGTTTLQRYIVRATSGNGVRLDATPGAAGIDTRIQRVNADESALGAVINNGAAGVLDTATIVQGANGWTAFVVDDAAGPNAGGTVDVTVTSIAPVTYMTATGTTAFTDICPTGTTVALSDLDDGRSNATINTPAGFDYFGFPAPALRVFSNGFVSFDTALACANFCFFSNPDMPNAANPNAVIAPYWDDLVLTSACTATSGTKLVVQWNGELLDDDTQKIQMQVILDGANDTIEFVYGSGHSATGSSGTVGIENATGGAAKKLSFNTATAPMPTLFTPQ